MGWWSFSPRSWREGGRAGELVVMVMGWARELGGQKIYSRDRLIHVRHFYVILHKRRVDERAFFRSTIRRVDEGCAVGGGL